MAHTITGKLNKPASQFPAGDSTGFGIRLGVRYKDPKTKEVEWTNYSAVIFAKSQAQIDFYSSTLVEDAIVSVSADKLAIQSFDGQQGQILTISMLNANLAYAHSPNQAAPAPQQRPATTQQAPQQQPPQGQYPQLPSSQPNTAPPMDSFDDDIPF